MIELYEYHKLKDNPIVSIYSVKIYYNSLF